MKLPVMIITACLFVTGCAGLASDVDYLVEHGKDIGRIERQILTLAEDAEQVKKSGLKGLNAADALAVEQLIEDIEKLKGNVSDD